MGKVHGSLARAGKVRGQTPKVQKDEDAEKYKKKKLVGRCKNRLLYNKRFKGAAVTGGKYKCNPQAPGKLSMAAMTSAAAAAAAPSS